MKTIAQEATGKRRENDNDRKQKTKKKKKNQEITIYRVGKATKDGRAVVKQGDPVDTVGVARHETVEDVITRFFRAQGSEQDRRNWSVRQLADNFTLQAVATKETPAKACLRIALLRKGG